ncbi:MULTISPECIES: DNA-binding protein [unclassified Streptomyces]|uniref:DNA-binding protein n=1 Tax=unclassified Streptomyces TaxID=2593676 RepID=UPI002E80E8CE|nr:DNA-binding protein [Streptomyces sp. NBC_00589]WTI37503.1 helix-turn-helix domain-containing protein [Streptomyces sp. NBC_00775]WUB28819.1 helix-turn-helix domain-containing protein [Streptomyces sp. NBC_00589]
MTTTSTLAGDQRGMSLDEVLALPATVNVVTAARALGIGHNKAYDLIKAGQFPVRTLMMGSTIRIPTAALWEALGIGSLRQGGPARAAG